MEEKPISTLNLSRAINRILGLISGKSGNDHTHEGVYAAADHNHEGVYAAADHDHEGVYAAADHTHEGEGAVDITDKIALSWIANTGTGENLTELAANPVKYVYYPNLGIVFFMIYLQYQGTMEEGEALRFDHVGGYAPKDIGPFGMSSTADPGSLYLRYETIDGDTELWVIPNKTIGPTGTITTNCLTGWYFCDGE